MQALFDIILPVFLLIGVGYALTRLGIFAQSAIDGLMKYAQNVAVPALLFLAIAQLDLSAAFHPGLLVAFYAGATVCFGLGLCVSRYALKRNWEDSVAIGFCCLFSNSLLLGLPINERAFGQGALAGAYMIIAFHSVYCYGLGIAVMEVVRHRGQHPAAMLRAILKAMFHNALVLAILFGFLVNLSGLTLPGFVRDALDLLAQTALPVALFALGGVLAPYRPEGDAKAIALICATALVLHPSLTWLFATAQSVPGDFFRAGVLTAAMAPGFNGYIFANMYGAARRVAATSVLISTALSIGSIWVWLAILS